jgi:prepilin-type processing-associated H-X9-DG protein
LRQWGLAMMMYYPDHDDYIPRETANTGGGSQLNTWNQANFPTSADIWYNALPPVINQKNVADYFHDHPTFYDNKSMFHCPSAKFPDDPGGAGKQNVLFSYAMNSKLEQGGDLVIKVETIKQPVNTVFFLENRLTGEPMVDPKQVKDTDSGADLGQPSSSANRFVARHNKVGNIMFADGHAEGLKGDHVVQTQSGAGEGGAILPQGEIVWTQDPASTP